MTSNAFEKPILLILQNDSCTVRHSYWYRFTGEVSRTHHRKIIETFKNVKGDRTSRIYERVSHARWWNQRQAKQRDDDDDTKIKSVPSLHDVRGPFRRRSQGYVRRRTNESPRESQICKERTWESAYMKERVRAFARARLFSKRARVQANATPTGGIQVRCRFFDAATKQRVATAVLSRLRRYGWRLLLLLTDCSIPSLVGN